MIELSEQKRKKLERLAKVIDSKEIGILEYLFELEEKFEETVEKIRQESPNLDKILETIKGKDGDTPTEEKLIGLIKPLIPDPIKADSPTDEKLQELIAPLIPTSEEIATIALMGIELPVVEKVIEKTEVIREIPIVTEKINEVAEKPEVIRDKLETLKDEDRLDKSAIKGLEKVVDQQVLDRAVSILDQRTSFLINKVNNLPSNTGTTSGGVTSFGIQSDTALTGAVTISAGTNILLTRSGQNIRIAAISVSPTSFGEMTATGSRDTTNKDFTFSSQPVFIVVNGFTLHYSATANAYSFTWNAGTLTATIPQPVGTSGVIYGMGMISS